MNLFENMILKLSSLLAKNLPLVLYSGAYLYLALCTVKVVNASESYLPDKEKLATKAAQSKDLYVEPNFNFQTFSTYTLELSVNDQDEQPVPGIILRIFSTNDENIESEDSVAAQKSLLGIVRTDQYGSVYQSIEISQSVKQVLIELNTQSHNNRVLMELTDKEYISHTFAVD